MKNLLRNGHCEAFFAEAICFISFLVNHKLVEAFVFAQGRLLRRSAPSPVIQGDNRNDRIGAFPKLSSLKVMDVPEGKRHQVSATCAIACSCLNKVSITMRGIPNRSALVISLKLRSPRITSNTICCMNGLLLIKSEHISGSA
jgi:hypothetical protein